MTCVIRVYSTKIIHRHSLINVISLVDLAERQILDLCGGTPRPEASIRLLQAVAKKEKEEPAGISAQGMKGWSKKRKASGASPGDGEITDCSCGTSVPESAAALSVRNSRAEVAGATFFSELLASSSGKKLPLRRVV